MRFMGATWRRSGLSKAAMRAYYNDVHGPIVARDPGEIYRYDQNVVEDAVFYSDDAHSPLTQPDGLTEFLTRDQGSFERSFKSPHMAQVAWPDTLVYADLTQAVSVAGEEQPLLSSGVPEADLVKVMWFILVPGGVDRRIPDLGKDLASLLRAEDLKGAGVLICRLVTEFEHPSEWLRNTFGRPGPRAVAGITMFLEPNRAWEMPELAKRLIEATSSAYDTEAFAATLLVRPTVVVNEPPPT
nr:EthD domain-containing protein [Sphingomonas sp. CDS-1]